MGNRNAQHQRLDRQAENFKDQFSWSHFNLVSSPFVSANLWKILSESSNEMEVQSNISSVRKPKAVSLDELSPVFKKGEKPRWNQKKTWFVTTDFWNEERILSLGSEALTALSLKKTRSNCSNHRGINLNPIITNVIPSIILCRLPAARECSIQVTTTSYWLFGRYSKRAIHRHPMIIVFLDLISLFNSVLSTEVLCQRSLWTFCEPCTC